MAKLLKLLLLAYCITDGLAQLDFSAPRANLNVPIFQNLLNFQCEDSLGSISNPEYFRNGELVSTSRDSYRIDRMLEGNFSCGRSGVSESNTMTLVAWPDDSIEPINRGPFHGAAGSTVRLDCSITPGVIVEQYYVTWRSASQSRVFYQSFSPHLNQSPVNTDPQRYTLDPGNFSLSIHNATPADGIDDYLCILGVEDTHPDLRNRALIYTRTESFALSMRVTTVPEIVDGPSDREVVAGDTVLFTCVVRSSPNPVNIDWLLNDTLVMDNESQHYSITVEPSRTEAGYVISTSTFIISNAIGGDSSLVKCRINTGSSNLNSTAKLSVLDEVRRFTPSALQSGGYLYELELDAPLLVPVRLLFLYTEVGSGQTHNCTSRESYFGILIRHIANEEDVPFDKFQVQIALLYTEGRGDLMGPFFSDGGEYERAGLTNETKGLISVCVVSGILLIILFSIIFIFPCFLSASLRSMAKIDFIANTVGKLRSEPDGPAGENVESPPQENRIQSDSARKPKKKHNGFSVKSGKKYVEALVETIKFAQSDVVLSVLLEESDDYKTIASVATITLNTNGEQVQ